jgi:hypothetical protein
MFMGIGMTEGIWIAIIGGVIGPIAVLSIKKLIDNIAAKRHKTGDMVTEALQVGELVTSRMEDLKEEYGADRVWISQFHNGGHFYPTGKSIAKFSIFYETVSPSASSVQLTLKNIPVALFSRSFNQLLTNEAIVITDFKNENVATYGLRYFADENKTKSQYLFAIKNFEGKFIAVLGIDYCSKKHTLSEDQVDDLTHTAIALGGVLSNHLKTN